MHLCNMLDLQSPHTACSITSHSHAHIHPSQGLEKEVWLQPELHGMLPVEKAKFRGLQQLAVRWPEALKQAAALCTSLMLVRKNQVVGDLADKQAFKAVEARFVVRVPIVLRFLNLCFCSLFRVLVAVLCLLLMSTPLLLPLSLMSAPFLVTTLQNFL